MFDFSIIPEQASTYAEKVDPLFWSLTIFLFLFSLAVTAVLIYLGVKYRKRAGADRRSVHLSVLWLELLWSAIPAVIAIGIFIWGASIYLTYTDIPEDTLDINVIGKRWMWKVQHQNGKREVNELHVPVNQPVKLTMTSQDVIHSFYVPAFRVKQDVLPERYSTLWFEATKVGTYPLFCAEYCGTEHSTMTGTVTVLPQAEYAAWLGGGAAETPVAAGERLFQRMGCATCHASGDMSRGPTLNGVYGSEVKLRSGETVLADEEYIHESILEPAAKVVEGFTPLMPTFKNQLTEDDIISLIAYIKTLGGNTPATSSGENPPADG